MSEARRSASAEAAGGSGGIHGLGNNGEIPGYGATLVLYPDRDTVVAVMRNDDPIDALGLAAGIGAGLGVDRDPGAWSTPAAALLLLAHLLVLGGAAAWLIARRDV